MMHGQKSIKLVFFTVTVSNPTVYVLHQQV